MQRNWLYLHDGQTHGPFSVARMKELAAQGEIAPTDKIWCEGDDPKTAIRAAQALPFPRAEKEAPAEPERSAPPRAHPVHAKSPGKKRKKSGGSHPGFKKAHVAPPADPVWPPLESAPVMEAIPVLEAVPVVEAIPLPEEEPPPLPLNISPGLARAILAVQEPNLSTNEIFRRASFALSQWTDQDENAPLILAADTEAILRRPEVLEILVPFQNLPFEHLERLIDSLDFLVENRSRYYRALAERGR